MSKQTLVAVLLFLVTKSAMAAVWYVDKDNASGQEVGTSWDSAFTTIQAGIDAAFNDGGGEVWVAEGVYGERRMSYPHGLDEGNTGSVMMKEGVHLYGGFAGGETDGNQRDWETHVTTLDGSTARNGEPAYHVIVGANDCTLDGFTITGGNADLDADLPGVRTTGSGGGMYNYASSPTVINCTFTKNSGGRIDVGTGGGMYNYASAPTVTNCAFENNSSGHAGGGMYNLGSSPTVTNCTFTQNSAGMFGGGMYNNGSSPTVANCMFTNNSADNGAGMFNDSSSPTVINCAFTQNFGSGMSNSNSSTTVANCAFTQNGLEGMVNYDSSPTVTNCIFWGDQPNEIYNDGESDPRVTFSLVQGGYEGEGNMDVDPGFVDAASGDLQLRSDSPCIDAGTLAGAPSTDILGAYRPQGPGIDMGAYEYIGDPQHTLTVIVEESGTTDPVPGTHPIQQGTVVTVLATPTLWWRLDRWEGDLSGSLNPAMLTMDSDKTVTAVFVEPAVGSITGTVTNWRSGLALQGVAISVSEVEFERELGAAQTDAAGAYAMDVPSEIPLHVAFRMVDFESVERSGVYAPSTINAALEPLCGRSRPAT